MADSVVQYDPRRRIEESNRQLQEKVASRGTHRAASDSGGDAEIVASAESCHPRIRPARARRRRRLLRRHSRRRIVHRDCHRRRQRHGRGTAFLYRRLCVPLPRADYRLIAARVAPGKYITFFYAGHNPPLLQHRVGTLEALCEGGSAELPEADRGGGFPLRRKPCWL